MTRGLYAADFLQSGCKIEFDDSYAVDNTLWTYVSAYGVAAMALLSGALIYFSDRRDAVLMTLYFLVTSVGFALAGVSHQTSNTKNDWQYRILGPVALAFTVLGTSFLMRVGLLHYFYSDSFFANALWFASNVAIILVSVLLKLYIVSAIWMVVIYIGMSILYFRQATSWIQNTGRIWLILKILAMLVAVGGYVIQYILEDKCGVEGLQNCFDGCPLADPTAFNNTAIKNVLVAVGIIFLAIAEIFLPAHDFWDAYDDEESAYDDKESAFSAEKSGGVYDGSAEERGGVYDGSTDFESEFPSEDANDNPVPDAASDIPVPGAASNFDSSQLVQLENTDDTDDTDYTDYTNTNTKVFVFFC
jgi:hypothetical protein